MWKLSKYESVRLFMASIDRSSIVEHTQAYNDGQQGLEEQFCIFLLYTCIGIGYIGQQ